MASLVLLFVVIPVVEIWLLIELGKVIGAGWTVATVLVTGVLGAALARREGLKTLRQYQRHLAQGKMPGQAILDGLAILVGGAFLLTPGILTDVIGFALLIPPSRAALRLVALKWIGRRLSMAPMVPPSPSPKAPGGTPPEDRIYEQHFDRHADSDPTRPESGEKRS